MEFEWDETKRLTNLAKHGIHFEDAVRVFFDPLETTMPARTVDGEARLKTIGRFGPEAILVVIHTSRQTVGKSTIIRIIFARPASRRERLLYER